MQSMSTPAAASPAAQGPRILVVDDDPDIRELLCDYLRASGMRPAAVGDGPGHVGLAGAGMRPTSSCWT